MSWGLKIIIGLLIANLFWTWYLSKEVINPKRYYLVNEDCFVSHIKSNGELSKDFIKRARWRLPDAKKAKEVYPHLRILDCATLEELEE